MQGVGVQNRAADHPSGTLYKGHARHELPNAAMNTQVTNRLLVAYLPEYLVPLMAAVIFIGIPGWVPI